MARRSALVSFRPPLLVLLLFFCFSLPSNGKASSKSELVARKEDVKYIKCSVCEEIVKQLARQVKQKKLEIAPKKISELDIINLAENICDLKKEEGDWMMRIDIVEEADKLQLVEQSEEGECNAECKTIARACHEVMGDHDTDVAELIYKSDLQRLALSNVLCKDLSKACVGKAPPIPKDRKPGEPFMPKSPKDVEMEKLMRTMSDMPGAPGMQMFSRDQIANGDFGAEDDEDDEDDFEDGGTVDKSPIKANDDSSWKTQIINRTLTVLRSLNDGVNKVARLAARQFRQASKLARQWVYGSKKPAKEKSAGSKPKRTGREEL